MKYGEWRFMVFMAAGAAARRDGDKTGHSVTCTVHFRPVRPGDRYVQADVVFHCEECAETYEITHTAPMDINGLIDDGEA